MVNGTNMSRLVLIVGLLSDKKLSEVYAKLHNILESVNKKNLCNS